MEGTNRVRKFVRSVQKREIINRNVRGVIVNLFCILELFFGLFELFLKKMCKFKLFVV